MPQERPAHVGRRRRIDVLERLRGEVAAERIGRLGEHRLLVLGEDHGIGGVDEPRDLLVPAADAQCGGIAERDVQQAVGGIGPVGGAAGLGAVGRQLRDEFRRIRRVVDDLDGARDRARAVQRALRSAQHLDPLRIGEVQVDEQRNLIDVGRHQRHALPGQVRRSARIVGVESANHDVAVAAVGARPEVGNADARQQARDVGEVRDPGRSQLRTRDRRDVVGHVQHVLFAAAGGDDDFLERVARVCGSHLGCAAERGRDGRRERPVRMSDQDQWNLPSNRKSHHSYGRRTLTPPPLLCKGTSHGLKCRDD